MQHWIDLSKLFCTSKPGQEENIVGGNWSSRAYLAHVHFCFLHLFQVCDSIERYMVLDQLLFIRAFFENAKSSLSAPFRTDVDVRFEPDTRVLVLQSTHPTG